MKKAIRTLVVAIALLGGGFVSKSHADCYTYYHNYFEDSYGCWNISDNTGFYACLDLAHAAMWAAIDNATAEGYCN
jgi:hypothetical protein